MKLLLRFFALIIIVLMFFFLEKSFLPFSLLFCLFFLSFFYKRFIFLFLFVGGLFLDFYSPFPFGIFLTTFLLIFFLIKISERFFQKTNILPFLFLFCFSFLCYTFFPLVLVFFLQRSLFIMPYLFSLLSNFIFSLFFCIIGFTILKLFYEKD